MRYLQIAVEGELDAVVAEKVARLSEFEVSSILGRRGKLNLDSRLPSFNQAALHSEWFVVRDLDNDATCPPELVRKILPNVSGGMIFRIAVRSIESWLLADRAAISEFLKCSSALVHEFPDDLQDPKREMVNLARKSKAKAIREGLVPAPKTTAAVGPLYNALLSEFVSEYWSPFEAAERSPSLRSCLNALEAF